MTIYYVDQSRASASDKNAGTEDSPFLTIQRAANLAKAGDTIYVKAGTYAPFEIVSSGTAGNPIVFSAYPGDEHLAIIDGTGSNARGGIMARGESHIAISGFRVQNAKTDGIFIEGSAQGATDVVVTGNQIENTGNSGIYAAGLIMGKTIGIGEYRLFNLTIENNDVSHTNIPTGGNEAISVGGGVDGFRILDNWVHDSDQYGIDVKMGARNGEIANNVVSNIEKHGIYIDSNSRTIENVSIHNNTIHDNANGIVLARESSRENPDPNINNIKIYDNLVYNNAKYGIMAYKHIWDVGTGDFDNVSITSNTIYGNGINGIRLVDIGKFSSGFVVSDNLVFQNKTNIVNNIGASEGGNAIGASLLAIDKTDGAHSFEAHYNIGGPDFTSSDDMVFTSVMQPDSGSMTVRSKAVDIAGTTDDAVYSSYGFGKKFGFAIDVPKVGEYRVELHLAELFQTGAGKRVFDVSLEGSVRHNLDDIDIFKLAGGQNTAVTIAETVKVTDGVLNIDAIAGIDNALINGISIYYDTPF